MNLRSPANYLNSLWNWTVYNDCFQHGIRISDIDGIVERNGQILVIETKRENEKLHAGQIKLFNALNAHPEFWVLVVWGEPNNPVRWKWWRYKTIYQGGENELKAVLKRWFDYAEGHNEQ